MMILAYYIPYLLSTYFQVSIYIYYVANEFILLTIITTTAIVVVGFINISIKSRSYTFYDIILYSFCTIRDITRTVYLYRRNVHKKRSYL